MQQLTILGSTGSIGTQTLDVVRRNPKRFRAACLTGNSNVELLAEQIREFQPDVVVVADEKAAEKLHEEFSGSVRIDAGNEALCNVAALPNIDIVVSAIVGFAGLAPTLAAARAGKRIGLANKETMVVAGELINGIAREHSATIIPIDSEHSAVFQCLVGETLESVEEIILTASGGPFRELPEAEFSTISREQALRHPNWTMGAKITIDSATLMNKGLEVIEARWLFDVRPEQIRVVVHPQSIIHSLVQFVDGSVKAQLGLPDMRLPIQYALAYPERLENQLERLRLPHLGSMTFFEPDIARFPCLRLAYETLERQGTATTILNAANEIAVALFLEGAISFTEIPKLIERALEEVSVTDTASLESIVEADKRTREAIRSYHSAASAAIQ